MANTPEQVMNDIIAHNCRKAATQLNAAYKKIKKYDPDNRENAVAVLWLQAKVYEMANEYQNKAEDKPEEGKQYSLCAIAKGKTWAEAEVK